MKRIKIIVADKNTYLHEIENLNSGFWRIKSSLCHTYLNHIEKSIELCQRYGKDLMIGCDI